VLEDTDELCKWAHGAIAAAKRKHEDPRRARRSTKRRARRSTKTTKMLKSPKR
jgi:hypothetical protein